MLENKVGNILLAILEWVVVIALMAKIAYMELAQYIYKNFKKLFKIKRVV